MARLYAQVRDWEAESVARDTRRMVDDNARELAIYYALKAADEVAAALQAHLVEEHRADLERAAAQSTSTNSFKLLRQARERLGEGLRAIEADTIAGSDDISLRNERPTISLRDEQPTRATDI
jgi:hypothetical protein